MFGVGLPELAVIVVVAMLVFGPDRLPEFGRQAGRFVRQVRDFARATQDDLRRELGPEYADLNLRDLDPRQAIRKHILEALEDDDESTAPSTAPPTPPPAQFLAEGEQPPYDIEAT